MSAPESQAIAQPELFAVETVQGYDVLSRREREFVRAIFDGCTQREAAKRAGFASEGNALDAAASRAVKNVKVRAVLNQAWVRSGASIDDTLRQAAELQRRAFCEAQEAATAERRREAFRQWRETSALIASIHGKLQVKVQADVNVSGEVGLALAPNALPVLAQMRREAHEAAMPMGGRN